MMTVRTRDENGREDVYETSRVAFDPSQHERGMVTMYVPEDDVVSVINGMVFVMNEAGQTVAVYNLGNRLADQNDTSVIK